MKLSSLLKWLAALSSIAFASLFSPAFLTVFHQFTNIFASGRSPVRAYLFLAFLSVMLVVGYWVCRNKAGKGGVALPRLLSLVFMVATFSLSVGTFFWFTHTYEIPEQHSLYFVMFSGGEITSAQFMHNQFGKTVVALLVKPFSSVLRNADPGIALLPFVPVWYPWVYLVLVFLLLVSFIVVFVRIISSKQKPFLFTLAYSVVTFSILKNTIDGGLFAESALVSITFYLMLLSEDMRNRLKIGSIGLSVALVSYVVAFWCGQFDGVSEFVAHLHSTLVLVFIFSALAYVLYGRVRSILIMIAVLASLFTIHLVFEKSRPLFAYRSAPVSDGSVIGAYGTIEDPRLEKFLSIGELSYYYYHARAGETLRTGDVLEKYSILDNYYPVSTEGQCIKGVSEETYFTIVTPDYLRSFSQPQQSLSLEFDERKSNRNGWHVYEAHLVAPSCLPRKINLIQEAIGEAGSSRFILYNMH